MLCSTVVRRFHKLCLFLILLGGVLSLSCNMFDPLNEDGVGSPSEQPSPASNEDDKPEWDWVKGMPETLTDQPPVAQIVGEGSRGETVAEGMPYFVTWDPNYDPFETDLPPLPPWPDVVPSGKNRRLRFLTQARTHLIMVASGSQIDTVTNALQGEEPEQYWECSRSELDCERVDPEGFIEYYRIPPDVLRNPYISVFAMWSVPPEIVDGKFVEGTGWFAAANWFFHLADE